jgi:hypothetical protein
MPLPDWDEFLGIAIDEIVSLPGPPMVQVRLRLERLVDNLIAMAPAARVGAIQARREMLASASLRS